MPSVELHARLVARLPELVRTVMTALLDDVAFYGELPEEEIAGEITAVVRENLRVFAEVLRGKRLPSPAELEWCAASAVRRAEEGVPLGAVLRAYHVGAREAWRVTVSEADFAEVQEVTELVLGYLAAVFEVVTDAYTEELRSMSSHEQSARHTLLTALLAGEPSGDTYLVLAVRIGPHPDESDGGVGAAVAARRKLRRVQVELGSVLSLVDADGGTVLVPEEWPVEEFVARLARAAGASLTVGVAHAAPGEVVAAAQLAREILDVVRITERPAGVYRLSDVLLDYQLSRDSAASAALASLLEPLERNEDLLSTLELHLRNELNRKLTARMLHVHPNTVDYRLRRIAALTGLDPAVPSQLPLLVAALAARRR